MAATAAQFLALARQIQGTYKCLLAQVDALDGMRGAWFYDSAMQDHIDSLQVEASDLNFAIDSLVAIAAYANQDEQRKEVA